jgi:thiol-disulfide isomerase/thioredoxin
MIKLTLYTKPDCCLCDEAFEALERVRAETPFELEAVDISGDPELINRYGERIPVVHVSGIPTFEYRVDEEDLRQILSAVPTPIRS